MLGYLLRRLAVSLLVLLALSLLAFFLVRLVPGDTVTALLGTQYNVEDAAALRERYGLDKPLIVQYALWLGRMAQLDLGQSVSGRSVAGELADALPVTAQLMIMSLGLAVLIGIPLGLAAAMRHNRPTDYLAGFFGLIGLSVPGFWLGTLLILLFALVLGWLPSGRFVPLTEDPMANLRHMILPALALGAAVTAVIMRMTRMSMLDVTRQDYIRTARAKGAPPRRVVFGHVLRNGLIPVLTIVGIQAGYLLGGSVVIEEVFSLNGVGRLVLRAIRSRDYQLLQAAILLIGSAFIFINFAVDLTYALVDPRVRVEES